MNPSSMNKYILAIALLAIFTGSYAQLPTQAEYNALIDLYNSTNGSNWTNKTGWSTANPSVVQSVSNWYGVRTDANGHVTDLDLDGILDFSYVTDNNGYQVYPGNNLVGPLPSSIGNLPWLRILNFGGNQVSGSIPTEIGQLSSLVWLIGAKNSLTGNIPSSIGNLTNLDRILMEQNQLTGSIPSSIGNLTNLWGLQFFSNSLSGPIPPEMGNLTNLVYLDLSDNQLTGEIPSSLGGLTHAWSIGLHQNKLSGSIPASLGQLPNIGVLYLSENLLTGTIPSSLSALSTISDLELSNNDLAGAIPTSLGSLLASGKMRVYNNRFTFTDFFPLKDVLVPAGFRVSQKPAESEMQYSIEEGGTLTFTTDIDRNLQPECEYQWFRMDNGVKTELSAKSTTGYSITILANDQVSITATYYYEITNPDFSYSKIVGSNKIVTINTFKPNYIRTIVVQNSGNTTDEYLNEWPNRISYTYFDGLGRPIEEVTVESTWQETADLVRPIVYDEFDRESKTYLPYAGGVGGEFIRHKLIIGNDGNYIGKAQEFYASGWAITNDSRLYGQNVYEPSPLNRVVRSYGPGEAWAPTSTSEGKFIEHRYESNIHGTTGSLTSEAVIAWKITTDGVPVPESPMEGFIEEGGYYSNGQLSVKVTIDEDGHAVREYTDKQGRTVLRKVQAADAPNDLNDPEQWACTYYIYDDLNNLRTVLPPEGVKQYLSIDQP